MNVREKGMKVRSKGAMTELGVWESRKVNEGTREWINLKDKKLNEMECIIKITNWVRTLFNNVFILDGVKQKFVSKVYGSTR